MITTRITEQYELRTPFIASGMGLLSLSSLVIAVCNAGGMGILGTVGMSADVLRTAIRDIRSATQGTFGVNMIAQLGTKEQIDVFVEKKVPVVTFTWDFPPKEWVKRLRDAGCKVWFQIGSLEEAQAAVDNGADALIVQGSEAGGHNRAKATLISLLPAVIDAVGNDFPVIAAGGIADGRAMTAALALGADAVLVGTRMLATTESYAHDEYKQRIVAAKIDETTRHYIFGPEWPDASVRGLRNRIVREWENRDNPPPYKVIDPDTLPTIGHANYFGESFEMKRFSGYPPTKECTGDLEEMSLSAGESVGQIKEIKSAAEIVHEMTEQAIHIIRNRLVGITTR